MESLEKKLKEVYDGQRVLSIQSHVVHGYAGNKCSVFILQLHGFEVDFINSVQFSNHTGYQNGVKGYCLSNEDLVKLYNGLKINEINNYSHILSGYCGTKEFLRQIAAIIKDVKLNNKEITYVCDPVLGDNGNYYVPEELCKIYADEILPLAKIITPNTFELSKLSGLVVENEVQCLTAINKIHRLYPNIQLIIVTSGIYALERDDLEYCYLSERKLKSDNFRQFRFDIPVIEGHYVGTGDVFASLLIVWLNNTNGNSELSVCKVIESLQAILKKTQKLAFKNINREKGEKPNAAQLELQLIQSRYDLLMPKKHINYIALNT